MDGIPCLIRTSSKTPSNFTEQDVLGCSNFSPICSNIGLHFRAIPYFYKNTNTHGHTPAGVQTHKLRGFFV